MALYIITAVCELVRKLECRAAEADADNKLLTFVQLCQVHVPVPIAVSDGCKQKCIAINMYATCRRYVYTSSQSSAADVCGCGTGKPHGDGDWPRESRPAGLWLCHPH